MIPGKAKSLFISHPQIDRRQIGSVSEFKILGLQLQQPVLGLQY